MPQIAAQHAHVGLGPKGTREVMAIMLQLSCEGLRQLRRHTCDRNRPARALPVILLERPWVVVTVPALVLCARL